MGIGCGPTIDPPGAGSSSTGDADDPSSGSVDDSTGEVLEPISDDDYVSEAAQALCAIELSCNCQGFETSELCLEAYVSVLQNTIAQQTERWRVFDGACAARLVAEYASWTCDYVRGSEPPECALFEGTGLPVGAACQPLDDDDEPCEYGAICDASSGQCVRPPATPQGEACGPESGAEDCATDLYCSDTIGTCQTRPGLGEPCEGECDGEGFCNGAGVCEAKRGVGELCSGHVECLGRCRDGVCESPAC